MELASLKDGLTIMVGFPSLLLGFVSHVLEISKSFDHPDIKKICPW